MLKQRVITAVILVILVLTALISEKAMYWQLLINIMVFVGFWEWLRFCEIRNVGMQISAFVVFALVSAVLQLGYVPLNILVPFACLFWVLLIIFTISNVLDFLHNTIIKLVIGIVILSSGGLLVIEMKTFANGPLWILCFMVSVWAADVGAYFVGKRFGKTKLAPNISPGKTIEGVLGGLALAMLVFIPLLVYYFDISAALLLVATIAITVLISVVGDLFESKMKRHVGLKDSSQVLPGHGGVLDRIDSLLSGAPFFVSGLLMLGYAA